MTKTLCIIPARGGSKGIPRKNVMPLAGKPLIAYTIEQARLAPSVDRVVVSTDDQEIAAVAQSHGAGVVWRPAEISGDTASSEAALLYTLDYIEAHEKSVPDVIVFLQCTSPLRLAEDIEGTIRVLIEQDADSALAVVPFHYFLWRVTPDGNAVGINHDKRVRLLRQEREPQYLETGAVYVMRAQGFRQARHRFFGKTAMYVMPAERRLEIDDPLDFDIAQVLMGERKKRQAGQVLPDPIAAIILDFDGVFTDNRVMVLQDGQEAVICDRSDGWGIARLRETGIPMLVLSTETNPVVQARCRKLKLECYQGAGDKKAVLAQVMTERNWNPERVVFVGNDMNDLECMQMVGCAVTPSDANPDVLSQADLVLSKPGGRGALRELSDMILSRSRTHA